MRPQFWDLPLAELSAAEWEALCDGCGKCCLNKIEYEDDGSVDFTCVACRMLDGQSCQCSSYPNRHDFVPDCIVLTPGKLDEISWWLPATCAYRLRAEGKPLYPWHHLISGDRDAIHRAGMSVQGRTVSELDVDEDDWDRYVIEDLS